MTEPRSSDCMECIVARRERRRSSISGGGVRHLDGEKLDRFVLVNASKVWAAGIDTHCAELEDCIEKVLFGVVDAGEIRAAVAGSKCIGVFDGWGVLRMTPIDAEKVWFVDADLNCVRELGCVLNSSESKGVSWR